MMNKVALIKKNDEIRLQEEEIRTLNINKKLTLEKKINKFEKHKDMINEERKAELEK